MLHSLDWLRGKHIVFVGDSRARYQYINLAYHLLHRRAPPFDLSSRSRRLLMEFLPNGTAPEKEGDYEQYWASWYNASASVLQSELGYEVCDCWKGSFIVNKTKVDNVKSNFDMRYTLSTRQNAALTYVQWFNERNNFQGHWHPKDGFPPHLNCSAGACAPPHRWKIPQGPRTPSHIDGRQELGSIRVLREIVAALQPRPTHVILGSLWHPLSMPHAKELFAFGRKQECCDRAPRFVWRSDLHYAHDDRSDMRGDRVVNGIALLEQARKHGWRTLDLFNVTRAFGLECYDDELHLNEVARTHLNELLLRDLIHAERGGANGNAVMQCDARTPRSTLSLPCMGMG